LKGFVSWSGGKDSCLAGYKAILEGVDVSHLLNFLSRDGRKSVSHGIKSELLCAQAEVMGIPITQRRTTWKTYEQEFKKAASKLKRLGVEVGVFGDIDSRPHRDWIERVCGDMGIKPVWPLWKQERESVVNEFIGAGFVAVVVATKADLLGEEWVGRRLDKNFVEDLKKHQNVDICGEDGEYHTFVIDGPIFKRKINILESSKKLKKYSIVGAKRERHWLLDILRYEVRGKQE
jgi:diphthine-ammonia ligase